MSGEVLENQETVEPQVPTEVEEQQDVAPDSSEQAESPTEQSEQQEPEPKEQEPQQPQNDDQFIIKTKVYGEEESYDLRKPEDVERLKYDAQMGKTFTKKSQAVSEVEKANSEKIKFAEQVLSNPAMQKAIVAQQMNIDPMVALYNQPVPMPDPNLADINPNEYYRQFYQAQQINADIQRLNVGLNAFRQQTAQSHNTAVINDVQLKYELQPQQVNQVNAFMTANFQPNQAGMFSKEQAELATKALFGEQISTRQQLTNTKNIQTKLKNIAKTTAPQKSSRSIPEKLTPTDKEAVDFKEFVKGMYGS